MATDDLPAQLPPGVAEKLGSYVYALRDPRDNSVFYVGKGKGDRVFSHVWVAMGKRDRVEGGLESEPQAVTSAKNARISDIYAAGLNVEHFILRPNITPPDSNDKLALQFEQVVIAAFRLTEKDVANPVLTNIQGGHTSGEFIVEPIKETIQRLSAKPAGQLERPYAVLASTFDGLKAYDENLIYSRMREWWQAINATGIPQIPIYVVHAGLIRAVFRADSWQQHPDEPTLWRFTGPIHPELDPVYRGKSLSYKDIDRTPPLKNWSTKGWHLYV